MIWFSCVSNPAVRLNRLYRREVLFPFVQWSFSWFWTSDSKWHLGFGYLYYNYDIYLWYFSSFQSSTTRINGGMCLDSPFHTKWQLWSKKMLEVNWTIELFLKFPNHFVVSISCMFQTRKAVLKINIVQYIKNFFLSEVNNRETIVAIEPNKDAYCLQKRTEKLPMLCRLLWF